MAQENYWSKKTPFSIFVDPAHCLGFVGDIHHRSNSNQTNDPDDPDGTLAQPYIDRLRNVCSFYTYMADLGDERNQNGSYFTGWTGFIEHYARIPVEDRRNIMLNIQEYWTLEAIEAPNFYYTGLTNTSAQQAILPPGYGLDFAYYDGNANACNPCTTAQSATILYPVASKHPSWLNDPQIISEFARQAQLGAEGSPHLFPVGYEGGLTPGSPGATIGTFKSVAKRFWNDQAAYVKSRGTENVIQYSSFGTTIVSATESGVPRVAFRTDAATGGRSWWRGGFYYPNIKDALAINKERGMIEDVIQGSLSADMYGGSIYNWWANMGNEAAVSAWQAERDRLIPDGIGGSSVAETDFDLEDLNYWVAKGAGQMMHELYSITEELAQERNNPAYKKGLAIILQLDAPILALPNKAGGGRYAAQKWGYMKDPAVAADIEVLGPFGATDDNVPHMRKPDQVWIWQSSWTNAKMLFELGTTGALYGEDQQTAKFGNLTARSQVEKRLFKRPMMQTERVDGFTAESEILANSNSLYDVSPTSQKIREEWLDRNTLPNVYWDARIGTQYSEGASNNIRFWSAATGNCLPSPCVFDRTSPIAPYLNFNNDLHKNEVRIAIKKWMSEQNVQAVEEAAKRLRSIGFTPTVQRSKPALFADPDTLIGWYGYESGYTGATANVYKNRILKAAAPYTLIGYGNSTEFPNRMSYEGTRLYFDAVYGVSAHSDINAGGIQYQTDGVMGGKHLPPYVSRAVMFNAEYPWLGAFGEQYDNDFDFKPSSGDSSVIAEFARQAAMGSAAAPYLFPQGHPQGGLTPGSALTNIGVYRKVGARMWNDLAEYAKKNTTLLNTSKYVIHYAGTPNPSTMGVLRSGIRRSPNTIPTNRSYWQRNADALKDYDDVYDTASSTASDTVNALYASQVSADCVSVSWYNTFPSDSDWATGATFWFSDFNLGQRKAYDGTSLSGDYSFSDLLYWQTREHTSATGRYRKALVNMGIINDEETPKFAAIITPQWAYENGEVLPTMWNHWSGGRKNPTLAGTIDALSVLSPPDGFNPTSKTPDQIWIWDAANYYWWDIPTLTTYTLLGAPTRWPTDADLIPQNQGGLTAAPPYSRQTFWARNMLEKVLFGRPEYPAELKALIESDGISSGIPGLENLNRSQIQARHAKWLFDNSLTDGWWARNGDGAENRVWHDPNTGGNKLPSPCVLTGSSPLAPWLNFNSQITTSHIHNALKNYISDYNCRYVEAVRETIDRFYP